MSNKFHSNLEDFFDKQLERVNYWLSFAEAKNAALIAFNIAVVAFVADFQKSFPLISTIIMVCFVLSCIICLISFFPKTENRPKEKKAKRKNDNLIFWGDIAFFENEGRYIECVISRYFPGNTLNGEPNKMCYDLASEIIINSRIAQYKYSCFKNAIKVDIFSFFPCILLFVIA